VAAPKIMPTENSPCPHALRAFLSCVKRNENQNYELKFLMVLLKASNLLIRESYDTFLVLLNTIDRGKHPDLTLINGPEWLAAGWQPAQRVRSSPEICHTSWLLRTVAALTAGCKSTP
jgi:hypothetical protein